jgi:hypothetical protein
MDLLSFGGRDLFPLEVAVSNKNRDGGRRFAPRDTRPSLDRLPAVLGHTQSMLC